MTVLRVTVVCHYNIIDIRVDPHQISRVSSVDKLL